MSTTMPKAGEITRKWYILDAADKPLGRTATVAASILRGKHKVNFAPHADCGDHVIIINAEKAGMLPGNSIGRAALTRCRVFRGTEHTHAAQKPENWTL